MSNISAKCYQIKTNFTASLAARKAEKQKSRKLKYCRISRARIRAGKTRKKRLGFNCQSCAVCHANANHLARNLTCGV